MRQLFLIELNEINFDFVKHYTAAGYLPCLSNLMREHGLGTTVSEAAYENIEPWIQWVTVHTGKTFKEHGVFRLGDIVNRDIDQIWEVLERRGIKVGAVSPMNAANRLKEPSFFLPDPWTDAKVSADAPTKALYRAVRQAVGDNASGKVTFASMVGLLFGFFRHVPIARWGHYLRLAARARGRSWVKAIILDELLGDVFISLIRASKPSFATLFVNAGAHIQHHYLFNSGAYKGERKNPGWYVPPGEDPVLEVYAAYDAMLGRLLENFPDTRLLIATGLHQDPYPRESFYWRLHAHARFLERVGCQFQSVEPRMSRDFVVQCRNAAETKDTADILRNARLDGDSGEVFSIDRRGDSLFCELVYAHDIRPGQMIVANGRRREFRGEVDFVALKNAHHNGIGYVIDTGFPSTQSNIPLANLFNSVQEHFQASVAG